MKKNKLKIAIIVIAVIIAIISILLVVNNTENTELKSIKSEKELEKIYKGDTTSIALEIFTNIIAMPFSFFNWFDRGITFDQSIGSTMTGSSSLGTTIDSVVISPNFSGSSTNKTESSKDYSKTNIQVENVDEADITKTDGDYIYSISDNNVIITNVMDPSNIKVSSKINISDGTPEDLILYKDKLVIISTDITTSSSYYYTNNSNTIVKIYNIANKEKPALLKSYELMEPYYTSRCIENKLYVISSGNLKKENNKIVTYYNEDREEKQIELGNIKYLKDLKTKNQTIISMLDLDNPTQDVNINSYLIDISNAYVSEHNIYLLDYKYDYDSAIPISTLFGVRGVFGPIYYEENNDTYSGYKTKIYKFNILKDGTIKYDKKTTIEGRTINQFSIDEYNGNLRVALYDNNGSRVVIFNNKLDKIGETEYLAKGENMYSSRFMGDKAYLVTYRTMDPLYVIDLSNPKEPKVLGELKIPGYSTYLHPYDENHLIGIGMETKETVRRNSSGKVISISAQIVGMKMALFDISDVNNPIQISSTVIGDRRTTSAILTNHKALLFSKEKELIAIPVNNYEEDFSINSSADTYSSVIDLYKNYSKNYISEGYFVYNINIEDGFSLKGVINHEKETSKYSYYNNSKLLRGLYIDDNLYTISETAIKVNRLDNLEEISELKIR